MPSHQLTVAIIFIAFNWIEVFAISKARVAISPFPREPKEASITEDDLFCGSSVFSPQFFENHMRASDLACGKDNPCLAYVRGLSVDDCPECIYKLTVFARNKVEATDALSQTVMPDALTTVLYVKPYARIPTNLPIVRKYVSLTMSLEDAPLAQQGGSSPVIDVLDEEEGDESEEDMTFSDDKVDFILDPRAGAMICPKPCYCRQGAPSSPDIVQGEDVGEVDSDGNPVSPPGGDNVVSPGGAADPAAGGGGVVDPGDSTETDGTEDTPSTLPDICPSIHEDLTDVLMCAHNHLECSVLTGGSAAEPMHTNEVIDTCFVGKDSFSLRELTGMSLCTYDMRVLFKFSFDAIWEKVPSSNCPIRGAVMPQASLFKTNAKSDTVACSQHASGRSTISQYNSDCGKSPSNPCAIRARNIKAEECQTCKKVNVILPACPPREACQNMKVPIYSEIWDEALLDLREPHMGLNADYQMSTEVVRRRISESVTELASKFPQVVRFCGHRAGGGWWYLKGANTNFVCEYDQDLGIGTAVSPASTVSAITDAIMKQIGDTQIGIDVTDCDCVN